MNDDLQAIAAFENMCAQQASRVCLLNGLLQLAKGKRKLTSHIDEGNLYLSCNSGKLVTNQLGII